jgi:serine/threonine-protein kinase
MFFRGQTIGKYKILSALGSGGFGTVYLAEDTWIDKKVALKVPHRQSVNFGELLKEPRLLASLSHPNIVSVLTAEKQDNIFFIVMEYVSGETLESIIAREGSLDLHRDLRPANVLVSESGLVKVADFGTSRFLELAAHGTTVIGSPPYMAPEQFKGRATFASDIYSLGVTMYQMMTGSLPYQTPAPEDLDRLMSGDLVSPPRTRNARMPQRISDIIMRAMAPDVAARYQRAGELLEDLLRATDRTPARLTAERPGQQTQVPRTDPAPAPWPRPRDTPPQPRFCWNCRKPLHARSDRCPFCGEAQ